MGPGGANGGVDTPGSGGNGGNGGNGPSAGAPDTPEERTERLSFECNPDARAENAEKPLRRLSRVEFENTLRDLITVSTSGGTANDVIQSVGSSLSSLPTDTVSKHAAFARMDNAVSQQHVEAFFNAGKSTAAALTSSEARVGELLGSCSSASGSAADTCVDNFIKTFGKRALRHPLSDAEVAFYRDVYASPGAIDRTALADVITVMLSSPAFVYQIEYGSESLGNSLYRLSDHEIASRLAFQFWGTGPDDELLAAADRGELSDDDGFEAALDRVLDDPRAERTLAQFSREWLGLNDLRPLDSLLGDPVFDSFVAEDVPSPDLRDDMIQEVADSFSYHVMVRGEGINAWVQSPYSFARSEELASIYNTPVWDGQSDPPRFTESQRAGLLTRAALLSTGSANTRPIMKGVLIRERLLCDELAPPPNNANANPPQLSATQTTREVVEALTEQEGSSCAGCHRTQINPLGFATEGFDSLGRVRENQRLFDEQGSLVAERPVDTATTPGVWLGDTSTSTGPQDLTRLVVESGKVEACFARQVVRYAAGRAEDEAVDGCSMESVRASLAQGGSVRDALREFALQPSFRQRLAPGDG